MHAAAGERIEVGGQGGDERFALASFHFGDFAVVQHDAADELHIEVAHVQLATAHFAHQRKSHGQHGSERRL